MCPFESEGMEKDIPRKWNGMKWNENRNKAGVAIIISDEMTFNKRQRKALCKDTVAHSRR